MSDWWNTVTIQNLISMAFWLFWYFRNFHSMASCSLPLQNIAIITHPERLNAITNRKHRVQFYCGRSHNWNYSPVKLTALKFHCDGNTIRNVRERQISDTNMCVFIIWWMNFVRKADPFRLNGSLNAAGNAKPHFTWEFRVKCNFRSCYPCHCNTMQQKHISTHSDFKSVALIPILDAKMYMPLFNIHSALRTKANAIFEG